MGRRLWEQESLGQTVNLILDESHGQVPTLHREQEWHEATRSKGGNTAVTGEP